MAVILYLGACFLLGFGIAIDVALASIAYARFLETPRQQWQWVIRITTTHVTFPMVGYYSAFSLQQVQWLQPLIGIVGFLLIAWFLLGIAGSFFDTDEGRNDGAHRFGWALILAVSWDALWSGPAKAAQAVGWTPLEVALSFPLAGLVVACAAVFAMNLGQRMRNARLTTSQTDASSLFDTAGKLLEIAVFSYFAFLSLFTFTLSWAYPVRLAVVAAVITALLGCILPLASHYLQRRRAAPPSS